MKVILIVASLLAFSFAADASPGRTNGKGCHTSKRDGYHCHSIKKVVPSRASGIKPPPRGNAYGTRKQKKKG